MQKIIVLLLIAAFLLIAWFLNIYFQKIIKPRKSLGRLLLYFLAAVILIMGILFSMIFMIGKLYPQEILK